MTTTFVCGQGQEAKKANFESSQVEIVYPWSQVTGEAMASPTGMMTIGVVEKIMTAGETVVAHRSAKAVEVDVIPKLHKVRHVRETGGLCTGT